MEERTIKARRGRILGLDLARGVAVLGMIVVNFETALALGQPGPGWLKVLAGGLHGRAAATFVVLAGIGLSLMSARARISADPEALASKRRILWGRSAILFVGGLLFTTIWSADILHYYGVYIAIGACFLAAGNRVLLGLAAGVVAVFPMLLLVLDYERGWDWQTLTYHGLFTASGMVRNLFFNGFHPVVPWLAFLIFGLWLGRLDWRDSATRRRLMLWGAVLMLGIETFSALLVWATAPFLGHELASALLGTEMLPPMPFYMLAGSGAALLVIGISIELHQRFPRSLVSRALVATGQLAATHYVAHVVLGFGALEAFGRLEGQSFVFAIGSALVYGLFTLGVSLVWQKRFGHGPIEALLRMADPDPPTRDGAAMPLAPS